MWVLPEKRVSVVPGKLIRHFAPTSFTDSFKELLPNQETVMSFSHMRILSLSAPPPHCEENQGGFE